MSKLLKSLVVSTLVFALGAPAITSASATSGVLGTAVKVSYADLNLGKAEGAEVLYRRLRLAAKQVCGVQPLRIERSLSGAAQTRTCFQEALDSAVQKIDNENVSRIHAG